MMSVNVSFLSDTFSLILNSVNEDSFVSVIFNDFEKSEEERSGLEKLDDLYYCDSINSSLHTFQKSLFDFLGLPSKLNSSFFEILIPPPEFSSIG